MSTSIQREQRRRRWRASDVRPVRFPAWREWEDSRVRLDDATLDAIAGLQLARVALADRSDSPNDLVPDLFTDAELPHRNGFSVSVTTARRRLDEAQRQLALNSFVMYVSGFDDLLGGVILMLRRLDIGTSSAAEEAERGVSAKLRFLRAHCGVKLKPEYEHLHGLLVEIRIAVVHERSAERPVKKHWESKGKPAEKARAIWLKSASQPFPFHVPPGRLRVTDREVIACQICLDLIAMDLVRGLRTRLSGTEWAHLVYAEMGEKHHAVLSDPRRGAGKLKAWARHEWRVEISDADAKAALP